MSVSVETSSSCSQSMFHQVAQAHGGQMQFPTKLALHFLSMLCLDCAEFAWSVATCKSLLADHGSPLCIDRGDVSIHVRSSVVTSTVQSSAFFRKRCAVTFIDKFPELLVGRTGHHALRVCIVDRKGTDLCASHRFLHASFWQVELYKCSRLELSLASASGHVDKQAITG